MTGPAEPGSDRRPTTADPVPTAFVPGRTIVFPHLPRTGGSTILHLFRTVVGTERTRTDVHRYDLDPEVLRSMAFVEGHRRVGGHVEVFGDEWVANGFTMVREPVSRVVSQARHMRARRASGSTPGPLAKKVRTPADVFDAVRQLSELQCRMLAAPRKPGDPEGPAGQLERAKATLDQVAFGLTEAFDASVALLAEHFGMWLPAYGQTNASPRQGDRDLRSEAFREEARRRNEHDAALYAYARDLFWQRVARYVDALDALDLDEAPLDHELKADRMTVADRVVARGGRVRLSGWLLVDGHAADAVVARVGDRSIPVACGIHHRRLGLTSGVWDNLYGGVIGTLDVPDDVPSFELVAIDRRRGRRASRTFTLDRHANRALLGEAARRATRATRRRR